MRISDIICNKEESMEMAYYLVVGEKSLDEIMDEIEIDREKIIIFPFNPHNITNQDIEDLEQYYVEKEDYEKCAEIRKCLKNKNL